MNVHQNIRNMTSRKSGKPAYLLVTIRSMNDVRRLGSVALGVKVSAKAPSMNPYFSLVMALSTSSFRADTIRSAPRSA